MLAPVIMFSGNPESRDTLTPNLTANSSTIVSINGLRKQFQLLKIILTRIDNDIYSTVDVCLNACEMWKSIERLKQGESINVQDLETNLYWEFGKFTSHDGESLESYYSRFYKMMNELVRNQCHVINHQVNVQFLLQLQPEWQRFVTLVKQSQELKTVSYHKLYDILKQHQNEVNEIRRAERLGTYCKPTVTCTRFAINDNLALMLAPDSDETIRLEKERRSKLSDLIRPFDYDQLNNLYDLFVPQREKSAEQHYFPKTSKMSHTSSNKEFSKESFRKQTTLLEKRMDESIPWDQKCKSSKELFKIKKSVDTIFDGVERCKQTIAKRTYFGNIDPFIQNTIEGNFGPQISRLNADLEKFHLCLNEEMVADLRYFNSLEHEVDTLKSQLETQKTQFLNEIDRLSREYYYADHMNAILGVYTDLDEFTNLQCDYVETWEKCEHLEKELSKSRTMSKSFEALQKHAINLELDLQQCKEKIKNDKSFKENQSNVFLKEREQYFEIQDLKAQLQDKGIAISELKKLIEKMKGKYVETKFEKSSVIRQPNAFKSQRQSILGKPTIFSDSLAKKDFSKSKPVTIQNVSNDLSKPFTAQILPQNMLPIVKNTNVIAPGIVSRPQLKSNHLEDRVMSNNSQVKKQEVEDHRRNFKFSNNKTSVTACNDSLNAKTSNVNFVCATCGKCVLNENHDLCVLHYINGVNSRTRKPMAVPISTRKPKQNVNQSVATSSKKTVATDSTVKKSRNITRKLYEQLVEIILFIVDSGCSKHMTGNLKLLTNFVEKFLGTVKFGNDQIAPILGYGDLVQGTITIKRVYYVEGLNHNLFSVGQFCDADLEVAFRKSTCYIRDLKGNDLLTGSRGTDLYSISLQDSTSPNPICLMAKATSSQAWLWHRRLSHLNFDTINLLSKNNIVNGLPKLKFVKDHLCSSCELGCGPKPVEIKGQRSTFFASQHKDKLFVCWKSRIKRYIDTKPNSELIHYCLQNPPYTYQWTEKTVLVAEGIDNDIYSIVDVCPNACEMWKAIKRLKEASRPDIVHATCYCARYQAKPTEKHLTAVKRIFRYLKDSINMGLWYPKDTGFELTAFSYSDHAGCLDSRKSTSGGIQS
ncbi:retrovirus-related pol polyprotein from transposon TNT 1-94 [Tanacetum coccineum]